MYIICSELFVEGSFRSHLIVFVRSLGIFVSTFYHLFVNDQEGILGTTLRSVVGPVAGVLGFEQDKTFAVLVVSLFMQICGLLQLPFVLGSSFQSPFVLVGNMIMAPFSKSPSKKYVKPPNAASNKKKKN